MTQPSYVPHADRDDIFEDVAPEVANETVWRNPTKRDYALELHVGATPTPGRKPRSEWERRGVKRLVIKAGETRAISSEFDKAIQDVRDGIIVGGLGPDLENMGAQARPILHPALDAVDAQKRAAMQRAEMLELDAFKSKSELAATQAELAAIKAKLEERERNDPRGNAPRVPRSKGDPGAASASGTDP